MSVGKRMTLGVTLLTAFCGAILSAGLLWSNWMVLQKQGSAANAGFMQVMGVQVWIAAGAVAAMSLLTWLFCTHGWHQLTARVSHAARVAADLREGAFPNSDPSRGETDPDLNVLFHNLDTAGSTLHQYAKDLNRTLERMACGDFTSRLDADAPVGFAPIQESLNSISDALGGLFLQVGNISKWAIEAAYAVNGTSSRMIAASQTQSTLAQSMRDTASRSKQDVQNAANRMKQAASLSKHNEDSMQQAQQQLSQFSKRLNSAYSLLAELSSNVQSAGRMHRQNALLAINASAYAPPDRAGFRYAVAVQEVQVCAQKGEMATRQAVTQLAEMTELCEDIYAYMERLGDILQTASLQERDSRTALEDAVQNLRDSAVSVREMEKNASMLEAVSRSTADCSQLCGGYGADLSEHAKRLSHMAYSFHTHGNTSGTTSSPIIFETVGENFTVS